MKQSAISSALAAISLFATAHASAAEPRDVLATVQLCAESTPFPGGVEARAVRERWSRLDAERLENLRSATDLARTAERGWVAAEEGVMLTLSNRNDRLAALGEPLEPSVPAQPVAACTVYGTRTNIAEIRAGLRDVSLLGQPLGDPIDELSNAEGISASQWLVRGQGQLAYVYAQFAGQTAIVEVGRVVSLATPSE